MPALPQRTIYVITDPPSANLSHEVIVQRLLAAGGRLIQVREKARAAEPAFHAEAERCAALARRAGATLILNDDPHLAKVIGAAGVHIGQDDMPPAEARRIVGDAMIVGLSTHNPRQLHAALREPVDYIAVGPVFGTRTKANPDPETGLDLVREAARVVPAVGKQLVCIGNIGLVNLTELLSAAPMAIPAVIGAIMRGPDLGMAFQAMEGVLRTSLKTREAEDGATSAAMT